MRVAPRAASAWLSEGLNSRLPIAPVPGRIVRSVDFERVLAQPARARSMHFAVHFASGAPSRPAHREAPTRQGSGTERQKLSTSLEPVFQQAVDDIRRSDPPAAPIRDVWLGTVVPKRHARRAVTRNLIKREIRGAAQRLASDAQPLASGMWVVRLRAPFDRAVFASAASVALRSAARQEIEALLSQCRARPAGPAAQEAP